MYTLEMNGKQEKRSFVCGQPINQTSTTMPLSITYTPISIGKLRMWTSFLESFKMLQGLGQSLKLLFST